jgi:transposase InsO family protein
MGPRKIRSWCALHQPALAPLPALSTLGELFRAHGLTRARRRRSRTPPYNEPFHHCDDPNRVWSADFKGQFRLGNGRWCYPLTVSDNYSRFLLSCRGCYGTGHSNVYHGLDRVFREYGLPEALRTDNGVPFASTGLAGLSRLSVWLIRIGVVPERVEPGEPQQNGRHERMHGSCKAGLKHNGHKQDLAAQQRWFNRFREEFNDQRPHEALGDESPEHHYHKSPRAYDGHVPEPEYTEQARVRRVRSSG